MVRKHVVYKSPVAIDTRFNTPLQQYEKFQQTWLEFAAQNFEQILKFGDATTSPHDFYVVPVNSTFFLTSATLAFWSDGTGLISGADASIRLFFATSSTQILSLPVNELLSGRGQVSLSFPMPLKIPAGTTIRLAEAGTGTRTQATIQGFLVPFII